MQEVEEQINRRQHETVRDTNVQKGFKQHTKCVSNKHYQKNDTSWQWVNQGVFKKVTMI